MPRTWPALLFIGVAAVLAAALLVWLVADSLTGGSLGTPPTWLGGTAALAALYLAVLGARIDNGRQGLEARFRSHGKRLENGRSAAEDWLVREIHDQCRSLGISRVPNVYVCDPEVFNRGPFAHAGMADEGRVGIPEPWLHGPTEGALRFVISHELSHVLHRDGFVREVVDAFSALFLRIPGFICAAFVLFMFAVTVPLMALVIAVTSALAIAFQNADPLFEVLSAIPGVLLGITSIPEVKGALAIAASVAVIGGCLILYRLWVERRQEFKADETALRAAGAEAAHEGIDLIAWLEGADGEGPSPVTREWCRSVARSVLIDFMSPLLAQRSGGVTARLALTVAEWVGARIGDGLWLSGRILSRIPGAEAVRRAVWRLTRTHPAPIERKRHLERLLAVREQA